MAQKHGVSLYVFTELPKLGLVAVLQRRGEVNHEKIKKVLEDLREGKITETELPENYWAESYPGGFQATVHGGINEGETLFRALRRECVEELGERFVDALHLFAQPIHEALFGAPEYLLRGIEANHVGFIKEENEHIAINAFIIKLPPDFLDPEYTMLGLQTGGIRFVNEELALRGIYDLKKHYNRDIGVCERPATAMFPDDISLLQRAFMVVQHMHVK